MPNIAMKRYEYVISKPVGIPNAWPAESRELGESTILPDESGEWELMTVTEFQDHVAATQSAYNTWYAAYNAPAQAREVTAAGVAAWKQFAAQIQADAEVNNILAQYTPTQVRDILRRTADLDRALTKGALYVAIIEIDAIIPDGALLTTAKLAALRNRIQDFLNIPRT